MDEDGHYRPEDMQLFLLASDWENPLWLDTKKQPEQDSFKMLKYNDLHFGSFWLFL